MSLNTPWGPAQQQTKIADGVMWVSTAGHGGLMVKQALAGIELSQKAIECAYPGAFGYWICFEEDCSYAVAFHEKPEWNRAMKERSLAEWRAVKTWDSIYKYAAEGIAECEKFLAWSDERIAAYHAKTVKYWNPEYFGLPNRCGSCEAELPEPVHGFTLCAACSARRKREAETHYPGPYTPVTLN